MSVRAIASATVSFGLVSIPVKIYSASNPSAGIRFNMLEKETGSRLAQQYVSKKTGKLVERKDMAKGYEFAKGQFVLFTDEELKALQEEATQTIEIVEFLPAGSVDPIYFDKSYYLGPDKGGDRAYKLLSKALGKSAQSALAKYSARGKQYLVQVRPLEDGLVMQQLHYADEVRKIDEVPLGDGKVKDAELDLALQIVKQSVAKKFQPENYEDEVRKRMLAAIERKVEGHEITSAPQEAPGAKVIDLMDALKASLGTRKPAKRSGRKAKSTKTAAAKTTRKKAAKKARS